MSDARNDLKTVVKRDQSIDILRGSAILFMLITHVNGTFFKGGNVVLDWFTFLGATICFSTFLFCSANIYGQKLEKGAISFSKMLPRFIKIVAVYFGLAFYIILIGDKTLPSSERVFRIFTLEELPVYIEFIIAFFFFDLFLFLFQKPISYLLKSPLFLLLLSIALYIFSRYLSELSWGDGYINTVKALLVGHEEVHSFGVLSYMPIFALGLIAGVRPQKKRLDAVALSLLSICVLTILEIFFDSRWERWPPSLLFHIYGLIYLSLTTLLIPYVTKLSYFSRYLVFMSQNTLGFFIWHLLFIFILNSLFKIDELNTFLTVLMNLFIFSITSVSIILLSSKKSVVTA